MKTVPFCITQSTIWVEPNQNIECYKYAMTLFCCLEFSRDFWDIEVKIGKSREAYGLKKFYITLCNIGHG